MPKNAKKIDEKFKGLKWITPKYKNEPEKEIELINQIKLQLLSDKRTKMLMTNYSFFSSILNEKIFSPSRWYIADGTDYPLKDNKYFGNYKKLLIELIKNKEIAVIYTVYPADRSTLYTYIDKSCFNEIKISKILNSFEIKDCYEIKN